MVEAGGVRWFRMWYVLKEEKVSKQSMHAKKKNFNSTFYLFLDKSFIASHKSFISNNNLPIIFFNSSLIIQHCNSLSPEKCFIK